MDSEQYKELNKIENSIVILGGRYQKYFDVNSDIDIKKYIYQIQLIYF